MRINWQSFLSKITNDLHVPVALLVFGVTTAYHFHTGKDLGTNYINSIYGFYGFLAGHFGCSQKWPDKDNDGIPDALEAHGPLPGVSNTKG